MDRYQAGRAGGGQWVGWLAAGLALLVASLACTLGSANNLPPTSTPAATSAPGATPTLTYAPSATAPSAGATPANAFDWTAADDAFRNSVAGSLAYNVPASMALNQTNTIQALLSPTLSKDDLAAQITETGTVTATDLKVTLWMSAELRAADSSSFEIQALHADAKQLLSLTQPTEWKWNITAKKAGLQTLTLTVFRLVQYKSEDYWPETSYERPIQVNVTLGQQMQNFNPSEGQMQAAQIIVAFVFGVAFVITLLVLAIKFPKPTPFQYTTFRVILALAAAGVAAMIPGFISLEVNAPAGLLIRAGGALAVFVVVYYVNPAKQR